MMEPMILIILKDYWHLLVFGVGLIIGWVNLRNKDNEQEKRLTKLEANYESLAPVLLQIQKDIVEIKTTLAIHLKDK